MVNLLTGFRAELTRHFASHMDVNAIVVCDADREARREIQTLAAENLKRVVCRQGTDWSRPDSATPYLIRDTQEVKTTWHPIGI